jgi:hypothetical protein
VLVQVWAERRIGHCRAVKTFPADCPKDHMIAGFRTGPLGMGHVLIMVQDTSIARTAASDGWQL